MKLATTTALALATTLAAGAAIAGSNFSTIPGHALGQDTHVATWATEIAKIQSNPVIDIVGISELGTQRNALDSFLSAVDLTDFQRAVGNNFSMSIALQADNFSAGDVIAFKTYDKDSIRLIVDDTK